MTSLAHRLKAALERGPPPDLLTGDLADLPEGALQPAAVLVAITDRPDPGVHFTLRRENMRAHAGQVAFPGGRVDPGEDVVAAALREAEEEIGLPREMVDLWGAADPYRTITNFLVTPILGLVPPDLALFPHEHEVADLFEAPLSFVLDPANQQCMSGEFRGATRDYYQIVWNGRRIWGATAAMLINLTRRLGQA